jgi:Trypsin-like peptidase domain
MTDLSSTELGMDLETAIRSRDAAALADAVERSKAACRRRVVEADWVRAAIKALRDGRKFAFAVELGDVAMTAGLALPESRKLYAQALTDLGLLHAAEVELDKLLQEPISNKERGEVLGLLGRNHKQRFVDAGNRSNHRSDSLRKAIHYYKSAYDGGTDPAWHGANLVALLARAARDRIPLSGDLLQEVEPLARDVLAVARQKDEELRNVWARNTEVEALLALGERAEAELVATRLAKARLATAFELASLRRQLIEVWQLEPGDSLLAAIDNSSLDIGVGAAVDVPPSGQFESLFGNLPVGYKTYRRGLEVARFVAMITDVNGEAWGTGFLVPGRVLHDALPAEPLLITNSHVVSKQRGIAPLAPGAAQARFEVLHEKSAEPVRLAFEEDDQLFSSDPYELDCTILRVKAQLPALEWPIERAPAMPLVDDDAYVYVVGHPMRGGLSLSIRGNGLLAIDEGQARIHYRAPTEKGSSGSPVFDASWQLIGLHHYGSDKIKRLDGSGALYQANEGISFPAIRTAFMKAYPPPI